MQICVAPPDHAMLFILFVGWVGLFLFLCQSAGDVAHKQLAGDVAHKQLAGDVAHKRLQPGVHPWLLKQG